MPIVLLYPLLNTVDGGGGQGVLVSLSAHECAELGLFVRIFYTTCILVLCDGIVFGYCIIPMFHFNFNMLWLVKYTFRQAHLHFV